MKSQNNNDCEVIKVNRRLLILDTKIENVDIGTEDVPRKDKKGTFRMSFIEISVSAESKEVND